MLWNEIRMEALNQDSSNMFTHRWYFTFVFCFSLGLEPEFFTPAWFGSSVGCWNRARLLLVSSRRLWLNPSGSSSVIGEKHTVWYYIAWGEREIILTINRWIYFTVSKVQTEPVECWVKITSIQYAALHGFFDVICFKSKLLQGSVQILHKHTHVYICVHL